MLHTCTCTNLSFYFLVLLEKNYLLARQHFIHSRDGSGCAAMLVELHEQRGYVNEIDLFIAQAVLQYAC